MWKVIGKTSDLAPESACVVRAGDRELALVHTTAGFVAMDNLCPHTGGPLGEGLVQENKVTCPLHAWQFDCSTGKCLTEKRPNQRLYPLRIENGIISVDLSETANLEASEEAPPTALPLNGNGSLLRADSESAEWNAVANVSDLTPESVRKVSMRGKELALACTAEGVFACDNACPHEGASLGEGSLSGTTMKCPMHGYEFDCRTGAGLTESRLRATTYETKVEAGKVWVRLPAEHGASKAPADPSHKRSPVEIWKTARHGLDAWPDILKFAVERTPMNDITEPELERMKWYGYFYRKNNDNDHYMCRIRVPGCELTANQARTVAFVAYESGYSIVDVTTRGNLQVQGLTIEKLPGIRGALESSGLTAQQSGHDNVRNITSHPYSGLDPEELIDTRDLCRQIQDLIIGSREFSDLPRKFNVGMTGRSDPAAHGWTQDICFVAALRPEGDRAVGFQFLIGGNQGQSPKLSWHIPVFVHPDEVVDVTAATLRTFRELGYRHNRHQVRFRYLIERLGPEQILSEIEKRLGYELERSTLEPPAPPESEENYIGWFKQKQSDLWALGVCVPLGRLTWDQLDGLAQISETWGSGVLRTTYDQNIVLPGIPLTARQSVVYAIARLGLTHQPDAVTRNVVACTGKQFCNIAVTETKGYAFQLIEALRRRRTQLHGIHIQMSGCPSSCAMSYTADIGLKGSKVRKGSRVLDAFDVYVGGGVSRVVELGILYKKLVPVDHLPALIDSLIREYYEERLESQTFSQYWQERLRDHRAEQPGDSMPKWSCTRCGHMHLAMDPPPFCPVCAALRAKFEPASDAQPDRETVEPAAAVPVVVRKAVPPGKQIVIVGGSIGGHTAAQAARDEDPTARITIVTDEAHTFYNRLNLTRFLGQEVDREALFDFKEYWYKERRIEVLSGARVTAIDPIQKEVLLEEGRQLQYDACILAHGSTAQTPPFHRELGGVYVLRTLTDVEAIIASSRPGLRAVVVGGGVLGLESAAGLVKRGVETQVVEFMPHLMPRQLDPDGARLLEEMIRGKGIGVRTACGVQELLGDGQVTALRLSDGSVIETDLVIVSTGIKPNIDWVKRSGIHCNRGIVVDDRMATSTESIFAAGDVAEWKGQVIGLWTNAIEQAKVAGANAVGKFAFFRGSLPVTILKCLDIPLVSLGEIRGDGHGITSRTRFDKHARTYRRVVYRHGLPVGGILIGTMSGMGEMRKLVENGLELEQLHQKVVPEEAMAAT